MDINDTFTPSDADLERLFLRIAQEAPTPDDFLVAIIKTGGGFVRRGETETADRWADLLVAKVADAVIG